MRDSQVSTYIPYTTLFLSARLEHSKHDGGRMTAYYEEDDPAHSRLDLALWSRILAHARTYRRSLAGLAAAGMVVALCDAILPRLTGALVDHAVAGDGDRTWTCGLIYT